MPFQGRLPPRTQTCTSTEVHIFPLAVLALEDILKPIFSAPQLTTPLFFLAKALELKVQGEIFY